MTTPAYLVLEDGTVFEGRAAGALQEASGEVVFTTAMTGYQEALTDPSFAGQILVMTYPLQGNYGWNDADVESGRVQVRGFVVREFCEAPSHWRSRGTLRDFLIESGTPAIEGVDTRALTRKLRTAGVMMGLLTAEPPNRVIEQLRRLPRYEGSDFVHEVSSQKTALWNTPDRPTAHIVVLDLGVKRNILRILESLGCRVTVVPYSTTAEEVQSLAPQGVVISPGPGDPALLDAIRDNVEGLLGRVPIMGICLGHQLLARSWGAKTFKLAFGHRGANHPVVEPSTGRVSITSQNHGYAVDADGLPSNVEVSHIHLNDGTCEGLRHREMPVFTIQFHSEASPGPHDNRHLFERFLKLVEDDRRD